MDKATFREEIINLILKYPPEIPMLAKRAKHYDRIREVDFFRKMAFWTFPSIDTSYFALQTLLLITDSSAQKEIKEFLNKNEGKLRKFVFDLYDKETGGFFQTKENKYPTLHATHCVIGLISSLFALKNGEVVDFSKPATKKKVSDFFDFEGFKTKNIIDSILDFVVSCYDSKGGFIEVPKKVLEKSNIKRFPSINNTASATWCLFHLEEEVHNYEHRMVREDISRFIDNLKVKERNGCAYKNFLNDDYPWVCSTYYAERIIRNLGIPFKQEELSDILRFTISTKKNNSSFCGGNNLDANIIHTKDAMSLIKRYFSVLKTLKDSDDKPFDYRRFIDGMCQDVSKYLRNTYVMGGFATAEKNRFLPNVYATRLAYDIKSYMGFFAKEFGIKEPVFEYWDEQETVKFLFSCFDNKEGAFRGFSYQPEYILKEYVEGFFGLAA